MLDPAGNLRGVRAAALATTILIPWLAFGIETDPALVAPDLILNVREHPTTADIIEARARDPLVEPERLAAAARALGERVGSPPRGLEAERIAVPGPRGTKIARAYFATDHVVDREKGTVDLTSLVQAFCDPKGVPPIKNLAIVLDGEKPVAELSLKEYKDRKVWMRAAACEDPPSVEIRISLQTDSLEGVRVPYRKDEDLPRKPDAPVQEGIPTLVWILLGTAGLAAGALVYSVLARRTRR